VSRRRLIARLRRGVESRLTLVSAPAGFGKTTLLAEWLARASADRSPAGWVSLDQGDNDPALFWTYVLTALQRARPGVGARALALLHSPQPPPIEAVLTTLVDEISAVQDDFALVLDDFHVVEVERLPGRCRPARAAAGDLQRAAGLIEMAWPTMERSYRTVTWLAWVRELPDATIRARPVLCMGYAWALLNAAARRRARHRRVRGAVRELVPEGDHLALGPEAALLGLAFWPSGDLEAAVRTFTASMASLQRGGDSVSAIGGSFVLGDMQVARGRLRAAAATYEQALARVAEQPRTVFPGVEELHGGLGELHRERGDPAAADHPFSILGQVQFHLSWVMTSMMTRKTRACTICWRRSMHRRRPNPRGRSRTDRKPSPRSVDRRVAVVSAPEPQSLVVPVSPFTFPRASTVDPSQPTKRTTGKRARYRFDECHITCRWVRPLTAAATLPIGIAKREVPY
jgi:hypothetical protein